MSQTDIIFVAVVCFFFSSTYVHGSQQQDWYKIQIGTHVLPPYTQAYKTLQDRVLNELLTVNVAVLDEDAVGRLTNRLLCASRDANAALQQSVSATDQLRTQVDNQVASSIAQVGTYESSIMTKESEILQTDIALQGAQTSLSAAEQAVNEKQHAVNVADAALRAAEEDVEKARKCRGKRGWLSSIGRQIENAAKTVIIKPFCSVVNSGGVDNAKNRRGNAADQLNSARNQAAHYRQEVANFRAQKTNLEGQLNTFQVAVAALRSDLQVLQGELAITISINTELKNVRTQLSSVSAGSVILQDALATLIDFEHLISPLNSIYTSMQQFTAIDTLSHISPAQIEQAKISLSQVAVLLPDMPYNLNLNLVCSK